MLVRRGGTFLHEHFACDVCGVSLPEITPQLFSFNSPQGACVTCSGLGTRLILDPDLVVPNPGLSIREGAVRPWAATPHPAPPADAGEPGKALPFLDAHTIPGPARKVQKAILFGSKGESIKFYYDYNGRRVHETKAFAGIIPWLEERYQETDSGYVRDEIEQYMTVRPCPAPAGGAACGARPAVRINGANISEVTGFTVSRAWSGSAAWTSPLARRRSPAAS